MISEGKNLIEVRDLRQSFSGQEILRGVNLDIPRGETIVLLGQSGGGKSVFLRHLIGLIPPLSGSIKIDGEEIVYFDYVDLSVAVSAPNGLVVPVVRNADSLSFAGIEKAIADLGKRAREGTLTLEDMKGGTFTISNGGVFGGLMSTPIINPPQSAVLGLHRIEDRPVVRDGQIVIRPMMYLALSYDHRLIDGREAVTALKTIKEAIEDPTRLLIDL